jgi:hypothetical protein
VDFFRIESRKQIARKKWLGFNRFNASPGNKLTGEKRKVTFHPLIDQMGFGAFLLIK